MRSSYTDELAAQANLPRRPDNDLLEGYVVPGSWNPAEGTVEVLLGDTAALFTDYGDAPATVLVNMYTHALGAQYGPVGGERVSMFRNASGYSSTIEHGPDDTPGTPAGEHWTLHRNAAGVYDSGWQLTNDGPAPGDGLGGAVMGNNGGLTQLTTKSKTLETTLDDIAQTLKHLAGPVYTLYDATGKAISHVVPNGGLLGLGAVASSLGATRAIAAQADLSTIASNIVSGTLQTLITELMGVFVAQGVPNAALVEAIVTATGWVKNLPGILPTIPDCSSLVRTAP